MENRKEDDRFASYATKQASNEQQINSRQKKKRNHLDLRPYFILTHRHNERYESFW